MWYKVLETVLRSRIVLEANCLLRERERKQLRFVSYNVYIVSTFVQDFEIFLAERFITDSGIPYNPPADNAIYVLYFL